jgi:hypothetical protein
MTTEHPVMIAVTIEIVAAVHIREPLVAQPQRPGEKVAVVITRKGEANRRATSI